MKKHLLIGFVFLFPFFSASFAQNRKSDSLITNLKTAKADTPEDLFASLKVKEESNDKAGIASICTSIGRTYTKQKNYAQAEKYLVRARNLSEESGYTDILKDAYHALADLDSTRGNYKGAYENYGGYLTYRDSLNNEQSRKKSIHDQLTHEFEKKQAVATAGYKKELEINAAITAEKEHKQLLVICFTAGLLLLVIVFFGFIFRSLQIARKQKDIIEEQKNTVEEKKQEVLHQKSLVEEKQKEVIDSIMYARRIQRSLLPTERYIDKSLNRLRKK